MRHRFWISLFVLGLVSLVEANTALKIVSWNVRNYLLTNRLVDGVYRRNYPKPEVEKEALREVLRTLDADIVLFQEMGSEPFLFELQRDLKTEGLDYAHHYVLNAGDADRHLAVLSHEPFKVLNPERVLDFNYLTGRAEVKRGLMELVFTTNGQAWHLYNLHLKSRYTDYKEDPDSLDRRTAEARVIRDVLRAELAERPEMLFYVAGDFNDEPMSAPLRRFRQVNNQTLLELIPLADERGDRWTHYYQRQDRYTRVDMVLSSPAARSHVNLEESYVYESPAVRTASDHRPVVWKVDFSRPAIKTLNDGK